MRRTPMASSSTTSKTPCCSKVGIKRGPWTPEEDEILANYIKRVGEGRWRTLPKHAGLLRCGKSCRLRWMNYLRPSVKRGQIAPDEEDIILRLHRLLGNRWALIAGRIPGRTDNEIKNYWNTHLSKKLISQGIDPRTHKPLIIDNNPHPNPSPISFSSTTTLHFTPQSPTPNPNLNPNHNPNSSDPLTTREEETKGITYQLDDQNKNDPILVYNSTENWQNCDGYYDCDDIFSSSFLNSLINEDDFANQHHHQPQTVAATSSSSMQVPPVMSSMHEIHGKTAMWEAAGTASTMSTDLGNEQSGLNNNP